MVLGKDKKVPLNQTHLGNPQSDELVREDLQLIDHHSQATTVLEGIFRAIALKILFKRLLSGVGHLQ